MPLSTLRAVLCLLLLLLVTLPLLEAQDARGRIAGQVLDPSGTAIPRATLEATEAETHVKLSGVPKRRRPPQAEKLATS